MYEIALYEWKLTPEWINEHWTEELLLLMFEARRKRKTYKGTPSAMGEEKHGEQLFKITHKDMRVLGGNIFVAEKK